MILAFSHEITENVLFFNDGSNYVRRLMFDGSKPKIGCSSSITRRLTCLSPFDVRKNNIRVCSMSSSINLIKALLRSFEAKNWVVEFDHQYMNMFEFV